MASQAQKSFAYICEIRNRLLWTLLFFAVFVCVFFPFAQKLYQLLALPVVKHLPMGSTMIAVSLTSPFLTPLQFVLYLSFFCTMPVVCFQIWRFIAPALYKHERRMVYPILFSSVLLFYLGACFAYFIVLPMVVRFLLQWVPHSVQVMPDMQHFFAFAINCNSYPEKDSESLGGLLFFPSLLPSRSCGFKLLGC